MVSSLVSRTSAALLLAGGLALLFASDAILPTVIPGFPPAGAWLGQLLAAAWLGVATLNWSHRSTILGGVYGRPVVFANLVLYLVGALALLKPLLGSGGSPALWCLAVPMIIGAVVYGSLLQRGPFDPLRST